MTKQVAVKSKFNIGDKVIKPRGYQFPGTVVAVFHVHSGEWRYVVENILALGLLHIYSGKQLEKVKTTVIMKRKKHA